MVESNILKKTIVTFLIGYFLIGVSLEFFHPSGEIFPFFSWGLYTKVPQTPKTSYFLTPLEVQGKGTAGPSSILRWQIYSFQANSYGTLINKIGRGLETKDHALLSDSLRIAVPTFLDCDSVYVVDKLTYDPIDFYLHRTYLKKTSIGNLTTPPCVK
jgi:hypothetical protein